VAKFNSLKYYRFLRERVKRFEREFDDFIRVLINRFGEDVSIVLFGSRGRNDNRESSDFDMIVVVKNNIDRLDFAEKLYAFKPKGIPIDIPVIHIKELNESTIKKMISGGIVIHDGLKILNSRY